MNPKKLLSNKLNRRQLLGNLGMMGAGAALTACGMPAVGQPGQPRDVDAAILNFALNLEYLEAAFYLAVVDRLDELPGGDADVILPTGYTALYGSGADSDDPIAEYAREVADDELNHVVFLRTALGANAAVRPVIDLDASFKAAAAVAFAGVDPVSVGLPADFTPNAFDPLANEPFYLHGSFIFEDVGVTAYHGAAEFLTNPAFLRAAAGILAVEAYHSGSVRTLLYGASQQRNNAYDGLNTWAIVGAISDARQSLSGVEDDQGIAPTNGLANVVPTDSNSITFPRTPRQVANIVFLAANAAQGGFFPQGLSIPAGLEADFQFLLDL